MRISPGTVSEIMTRDVYAIDENDSLSRLLGIMSELRFRHVPVVDGDRLVGLLTERDILRLSASSLLPHAKEQTAFLEQRFSVRDVMRKEIISVTPETSIREAGQLLLRERIGCLPVVDGSNVLRGIVTATDFVQLAVRLSVDLAP